MRRVAAGAASAERVNASSPSATDRRGLSIAGESNLSPAAAGADIGQSWNPGSSLRVQEACTATEGAQRVEATEPPARPTQGETEGRIDRRQRQRIHAIAKGTP